MKSSIKSILLAALLTGSFILIHSGCKKENTVVDDGDPIVSTTGEATVGSAGGIISVGDETSPVYGASIEIPKGALEEGVYIKIVPGTEEYIIDGDSVQTVDFLPKGLEFKEQVVIGIPWSTDDQNSTNSKVYHLDPENFLIEELVIENVDLEKKITYGLTSHFSLFFNKRQYFLLDYDLMRKDDQFLAYVNLYTPLCDILPKMKDSPYANAEEIVLNNNGLQDCFAALSLTLAKKKSAYYIEAVAKQNFYIKYNETAEGWDAWVYRYDNIHLASNQAVEIFHKSGLSFEQLLDDWLSGFPIVAGFNENCFFDDNFSYNADDRFELWASWSLVKQYKPVYSSQVWTWGYRKYSILETFSQLPVYSGDENNNNIEDDYEGDNNPPNKPLDPQPANYASDVSVNSDLHWSCSDPDGDELSYNIYFGTESTPPFAGTSQNSTVYILSDLEENTTYYWYVVAIDPDGLMSTGQVWEFVTESGGGSIGCEGITSVNYEGQTYHTVEIGDQCWLKENLNVGTKINSSSNQTNNSVIEKYCYNNDEEYCNLDGALYQWDELMQYVTNEEARGICPQGWHIPSNDEWKILEGNVDSQYGVGDPIWNNMDWRGFDAGYNLKSTSGWFLNNNGSDAYGFTGLPGGYRSESTGSFSDRSAGGYFWNSSQSVRFLAFNNDKISNTFKPKANGYSVRCVMD